MINDTTTERQRDHQVTDQTFTAPAPGRLLLLWCLIALLSVVLIVAGAGLVGGAKASEQHRTDP